MGKCAVTDFIKKHRLMLVALVLIASVCLIQSLAGSHDVKMHSHLNSKQEMNAIVKENKKLIERTVHSYDTGNKIHSVEIDYEKTEHNPMGGIIVCGYINNNEKLTYVSELDDYGSGIEAPAADLNPELDAYLNGD